jgi:hypothetical protein
LYFYNEEIALMYLAFKSYNVERALIAAILKIDELIELLRLENFRI